MENFNDEMVINRFFERIKGAEHVTPEVVRNAIDDSIIDVFIECGCELKESMEKFFIDKIKEINKTLDEIITLDDVS